MDKTNGPVQLTTLLDKTYTVFLMYVCMPYAWTLRHFAHGDQLKTIVNLIFNLSGPGTCLQLNPLYTKYITSETPH